MNKKNKHILVTAGGTGGHVYPALAVARYMIDKGVDVTWVGTKKGIESQIVPRENIELLFIKISGLRGKGIISWLAAPVKLTIAIFEAIYLLLKVKPDAVLGMGGFASGPCGFAAWLLNIPLYVHEQNTIPGITNRILSHLAKKVMEAFPGSFKSSDKVIATGNPVREDINDLPVNDSVNRHELRKNLLVIGGSLGAQALNENVPVAVAELDESARPNIWHQSGKNKLAETIRCYEELGINVKATEFIENMAEAYAWADLVICRAGALTISELANAGIPSILVPYPYAVDDHQTRNATYLVDHDAAILVPQSEIKFKLPEVLKSLLISGENKLSSMAKYARQLAKPDATKVVAEICLELNHG